jgi:tape measure domain-containing protein
MSVELASAYVQIIPSMRGFGGTLSRQLGTEGSSAGRAAGSTFTSGFSSILGGGVIAGAIGGVTAAATNALAGAVSAGFGAAKAAVIDFNSTLQNATIGFTTMLGSGEKAKTFLDNLQGFAKSTPFEFQGLVQNSQTMLGMGIAAKDIIPTLTALGDSVASVGGSGDSLNQVILAFSQTMAKGTLDMGNMNQLLEGGIPNALKILAASYHVTTGEMVKMISSGKVQSAKALPLLIKGLEKGTSATAALGGMMDKQSTTFTGAMSNIADGATQLIAGAFKPLFMEVSSGAQAFATFLGSATVTAWAKQTTTAVTTAVAAFHNVKAALAAAFTGGGVQNAFGAVSASIGGIITALAPLVPAFVTAATAFSPLKIAFQALGPVLPVLATNLAVIASALGTGLAGAVTALAPSLTAVVNSLVQFVAPILASRGAVAGLIGAFIAWKVAVAGIALQALVTGLIASTVQLGLNTAAWVRNAAAVIVSKAQTIAIMGLYAGQFIANLAATAVALGAQAAQWVASTVAMVAARAAMVAGAVATGVATAAQWALNAALAANPIGLVIVAVTALVAALVWFFTQTKLGQAIWAAAWNGAVVVIQAAWSVIAATVTAYINTVRTVITSVLAVIGGAIHAYVSIWAAVFQAGFGTIQAVVSAAISIIRTVISAGMAIIRAVFSGNWAAIGGIISAAAGRIGGIISGMVGHVTGLIRGLGSNVLGAVSGFGNLLYDSGRAIIQGFIDGIGSMIGAVGDKVGEIMKKARDFFPHSPAKEGPFSGSGWTAVGKSGAALADQFAGGFDSKLELSPRLGTMPKVPSSRASIAGAGSGGQPIYTDHGVLFGMIQQGADGVTRLVLDQQNAASDRLQRMGYAPMVGA